jgi:hypothetical protein
MTGLLTNNELERVWKEVAMAKFNVLSQHLHGGTKKNHEKCRITSL